MSLVMLWAAVAAWAGPPADLDALLKNLDDNGIEISSQMDTMAEMVGAIEGKNFRIEGTICEAYRFEDEAKRVAGAVFFAGVLAEESCKKPDGKWYVFCHCRLDNDADAAKARWPKILTAALEGKSTEAPPETKPEPPGSPK